jgi:hypothetical protein
VTYIRMSYQEESGLFSRGVPQDGRVVSFTAVNVWRRLHETHLLRWELLNKLGDSLVTNLILLRNPDN